MSIQMQYYFSKIRRIGKIFLAGLRNSVLIVDNLWKRCVVTTNWGDFFMGIHFINSVLSFRDTSDMVFEGKEHINSASRTLQSRLFT